MATTGLDAITTAIEGMAHDITAYALILAAVGTLTMALLELLKSVADARMRFNSWRIRKWLPADALDELQLLATGSAEPRKPRRAIQGFVTGEILRTDVLYDQPVEKMMGQIQAAANMALDFPHLYSELYQFLANPLAASEQSDDAKQWLAYAQAVAENTQQSGDVARAATQARARIGNIVARKLDAFQTETQYLWAEYNQRAAVVCAGAFLCYLLVGVVHMENTLKVIALSVFGGLVAPFAKDVVSALSGLTAKAK